MPATPPGFVNVGHHLVYAVLEPPRASSNGERGAASTTTSTTTTTTTTTTSRKNLDDAIPDLPSDADALASRLPLPVRVVDLGGSGKWRRGGELAVYFFGDGDGREE